MAKARPHLYCSSSISNWRRKLKRKTGLLSWSWAYSIFWPTVFFGVYNHVDYAALLWHRGRKNIFWCGSDIRNLKGRPLWQALVRNVKATHFCENVVERVALLGMGIKAEIAPMIFDTAEYKEVSPVSETPHVWLCAHPGREEEYGLNDIRCLATWLPQVTFHIYGVGRMWSSVPKNVILHGRIPEEQLEDEIKQCQAGLRLNEFDGFGEVLAKSVLLGQYPISRIPYPHIDSYETFEELVGLIDKLCAKKEPNYAARDWWRKKLELSQGRVLAV